MKKSTLSLLCGVALGGASVVIGEVASRNHASDLKALVSECKVAVEETEFRQRLEAERAVAEGRTPSSGL